MRVDRRALHKALTELGRIAQPRATLPMLEQVHLAANDGTLNLTTTDLDRRLSCQLPAEGELSACIPCKQLAQAVKPEGCGNAGHVELQQQDDHVTILVDGLTSKMPITDPAEFPAASDREQDLLGLWPAAPLREALEFVLPAASKDETRPHLCTVLMADRDMVTTDGHRLHLAPLPAPLSASLLLPSTAAATLARILKHGDQAIVAQAGDLLRIKCGSWQLDARLSDRTFPPYQQVIPAMDSQPTLMQVQAALFNKAVTRISRLARDKKLRLRVNGAISMTTWDVDHGAAELEVPVQSSTHQGHDLHIGFDAPFLTQAVPKKADQVQMGFSGPLDPLRVDLSGGKLAVIMPLRLD